MDPPNSTRLARPRRGYIDWLRGLAVLIMVEAHTIDSWTRMEDRGGWPFGWSMILGGFGAPLFLFLAGVAVPLSAGAKLRKTGDASGAVHAVQRRGLEIFGLAFLFRLQAHVVSGGKSLLGLLKVDILNIMGPSIVLAAAVWGLSRTARRRVVWFISATLAVAFLTPIVREWSALAILPDPLEAYIRPAPRFTSFVFFPWGGFVFAGAVIGSLIDDLRDVLSERRLNLAFGAAGVTMAVAAYAASFLPSPYARSEFWGGSPAFFFIRVGVMTAAVAAAFGWQELSGHHWSPLHQFGRTSLFVYWIHVEMVYGPIANPIKKQLGLGRAWAAYAAFTVFLYLLSTLKTWIVARWRIRAKRAVAPA